MPQLQVIVITPQFFVQAADQCSELTREQIKSSNGVQRLFNSVYRRDFMSLISEAFDGFRTLLNTHRGQNETLKVFEAGFSAATSKCNSFSTTTKFPQCIAALMLLNNANIEHSKRVSALSAASPAGTIFSDQAMNDEFLKVVTYNQVSSIVKQCERANGSTLLANREGIVKPGGGANGTRKPSIAAFKKFPCHNRQKFGHWKSSHNKDGTLKPNTKYFDTIKEYVASLEKPLMMVMEIPMVEIIIRII